MGGDWDKDLINFRKAAVGEVAEGTQVGECHSLRVQKLKAVEGYNHKVKGGGG